MAATTRTKKPTLKNICWTILGRYEQLDMENKELALRAYSRTFQLAFMTTDNLCRPTEAARNRLGDLLHYLAAEFRAE